MNKCEDGIQEQLTKPWEWPSAFISPEVNYDIFLWRQRPGSQPCQQRLCRRVQNATATGNKSQVLPVEGRPACMHLSVCHTHFCSAGCPRAWQIIRIKSKQSSPMQTPVLHPSFQLFLSADIYGLTGLRRGPLHCCSEGSTTGCDLSLLHSHWGVLL